MKALYWLKDHWFLPVLAIAAFVVFWLSRGKHRVAPLTQVKAELRAIEAGRQARADRAALGAAQALEKVNKDHAMALQGLNESESKRAAELTANADPVALSRFLVKAGKTKL